MDRIHSLGVVLPLVEWTFIFIPLIFHAVIGWLIISGAVPNTSSYPYAGNVRYVLQRVTGMIAFFFILYHVLQLHHLGAARAADNSIPSMRPRRPPRPSIGPCGFKWSMRSASLLCVSFCQRHLDRRHYLGHLDEPRGPAAGQLCGFGVRPGTGRRGPERPGGHDAASTGRARTVEDRMERAKQFIDGEAPEMPDAGAAAGHSGANRKPRPPDIQRSAVGNRAGSGAAQVPGIEVKRKEPWPTSA